ncbi:MAG: LPS export ABC transporter periplasmic protein LptC [Candidatus Zixiibacteriota bacterium]|nr:MAG: LPS export ABC transporter periplasmic protein LptC [candidate division Zixibacteria bacterium]
MRTGILSIFALVILAAMLGCGEKNEIKAPGVGEADSLASVRIRPDQQISEAEIALFNGPVRTTVIKADYIEKFNKQDSTLAWGLDVYFYDREGKESSHLVADSGLVRETTKMLVANGNVVVVTPEDSARLETEQLFWNGRSEMITTDKFVTIYQHGDTLQGYGLEADRGLKRVKIKRQVKGTVKSTEGVTE